MITENTGYSLLGHNTFGIEAKSDKFIEYTTLDELKLVLRQMDIHTPYLHIGGGSNLLFVSDFHGTILHSGIKGIEMVSQTDVDVILRVGAGEVWDDFVSYCVENSFGGVENLSLIPGEVGASAVQNIGAYGAEVKDLIQEVEAIEVETGKERNFTNEECGFRYRQSIFKKELKNKYIVTYVTFRLNKQPVFNLAYGNIQTELEKYAEISLSTIRRAIIAIRESKLPDPKVEGNAGSFFMNPVIDESLFLSLRNEYPDIPYYEAGTGKVKVPAAWLIDRCGWKGKCMGKAGVHDKQALVLVNKGGTTGNEVVALSLAVRASVKEKFGIEIHPEVNFIGL